MRARKPVRGAPPGAATWPQGQEVPLRPQELTPAGHQETLTWKPREAAGTAGGAGGEGAGGAQWAPPPPCPPASRSERQPLLAWIPGAEHGRLSCGRGRAAGDAAGSCTPAGCVVSPSYFHVSIFDIVLQFLFPAPC